jgi:hypothetical protein
VDVSVPGGGWVPDTWIPGPAPTTLPTSHPGGVVSYSKQVYIKTPAEYNSNGTISKNAGGYSGWIRVNPIFTDIWIPSTPTVIGHWTFTSSPNYGSHGSSGWTAAY